MSSKKAKEPTVPGERSKTVRQLIVSLLESDTLSSKDISGEVGISEKEVYAHLNHIQISTDKKDKRFVVTPAQCRSCNFLFKKRERLKKPGKCPLCHSESITDPLFSIR